MKKIILSLISLAVFVGCNGSNNQSNLVCDPKFPKGAKVDYISIHGFPWSKSYNLKIDFTTHQGHFVQEYNYKSSSYQELLEHSEYVYKCLTKK